MRIPSGVTDQFIYFVAVDSTDLKTRETGLGTFTVYRSRNGAAAAAMTTPTINETDSSNMPGVYELLLDEDMAIAAGNQSEEIVFHITQASMAPVTRTIELYRSSVTPGETLTVSSGVGEANIASTDDIDLSATQKASVNTEVDNAIETYKLDHLVAAADGDDPVDGSIMAHLVSATEDWSTFVPSTDSLQAIRDQGDAAWVTAPNDPTAADIADAVWNEAIEDHDTQGNTGWMAALGVYAGPDGPGIYIDSGAANTNTVVGTDGTKINPVSTFAAARSLADDIGSKIYYLEGNSDITLAATHTDWEFIGIGSVADNIVNLGSQDVSRSLFRNLTVEGTQGGAGRITARDCALQDPGAGDTTLHIFAERCGFVDRIQVDTSNDNVFDQCYSLVAGTGAPVIQATGAAGTLSVRHYSGGLEFETLSASHNVTWEGIGQVIFNADCNVNANVSVRGVGSITDNTAGMSSLTETSLMNMTKVLSEVNNALDTAISELSQGIPTATPTLRTAAMLMYMALRNKLDVATSGTDTLEIHSDDGTRIAQKLLNDDGSDYSEDKMSSGA